MYVSDRRDAFYVFFHAGIEPLAITLPGQPWSSGYRIMAHTGTPDELRMTALAPGRRVVLPGRTVVVMKATVASRRPFAERRR